MNGAGAGAALQGNQETQAEAFGCAVGTNSAHLPQTTAASRRLGSVRLGYDGGG